jgi:hypothetical protein
MKRLNCAEVRFVLIGAVIIGLLSATSVSPAEDDTWTYRTDLPTARVFAGECVVDGKIYVIGGAPSASSTTEPLSRSLQRDKTFKILKGLAAKTSCQPFSLRSPSMKSSKSNSKIAVATNFFLRHPCHTVSANVTH